MNKLSRILTVTVIILSIVIIVGFTLLGLSIRNLKAENQGLKSKLPEEVVYSENGFNYLAIGNSITIHEKCSYWFDEMGMGASQKDKDYFHIVSNYLKEKSHNGISYALGFYEWEVQSRDRAETFKILDRYLSPALNLVTIQLGENILDFDDAKEDYVELINYIQTECVKAKVILVDDFWDDAHSEIKQKIAADNNILFASLKEIRGKEEYMCGMGTSIYDSQGNEHIVEHSGVSIHPGDLGMEYIANAIIKYLK